MRLAIIVIINCESAKIVSAGRKLRENVAILFTGGDREVTERLLVERLELERFRDEAIRTGGEETVR